MSSDFARVDDDSNTPCKHPYRVSQHEGLEEALRPFIFDPEADHAILMYTNPKVERHYLLVFNEGLPSLICSERKLIKVICSGELAMSTISQLNPKFKSAFTHGHLLEDVEGSMQHTCMEMIHSCLGQGEGYEFWAAVDVCRGMGAYAVPMLVRGLKNNEPYLRYSSARTIAHLSVRGRAALPDLLTALNDEIRDVRLMAGAALCTVSDQMDKCIPAMLELLGQEGSDAAGVMCDWVHWGAMNTSPLCQSAIESKNYFLKKAGEAGIKNIPLSPNNITK